MAKSLAKDHVTMLSNAFLQLLLQVPTPVLILTEHRNLTLEILKLCPRKAVDCEKRKFKPIQG